MSAAKKRNEAPKFLSGWKEIADYLGKGVRTVQRYERDLGFPVRRPAQKSRAAVVATKAEVDAWVAASPIRDAFKLSRVDSDVAESSVRAFQQGLEEMNRLRAQMIALRSEVKASVRVLRQSIDGIRGEVNSQWHRNLFPLEQPHTIENGYDSLPSHRKPPKAS